MTDINRFLTKFDVNHGDAVAHIDRFLDRLLNSVFALLSLESVVDIGDYAEVRRCTASRLDSYEWNTRRCMTVVNAAKVDPTLVASIDH